MNLFITILNFSLLTILLALYISSIVFEIIYFLHNNKNDFLFYLFISDSITSFLMIFITLLFGFVSIYDSSKDKLLYYILIVSFIFCLKIALFILFSTKLKNKIDEIKIIFIITSTQIIIIFINIISCLCERCRLIQELEEAPLNYVDENITPELYNSILSQCLNPEDKKLKIDFQKKLRKKKKQTQNI